MLNRSYGYEARLLLVACLLGVVPAEAQKVHVHGSGHAPEAVATSAAGAIDGASNPEMISDQEAITMYWISIMEQPTSGAMEKNRFAAKLSGMNLSPSDVEFAWKAALNFQTQFMPYQAQAQQLAGAASNVGNTPTSSASIKQQRIAAAAAIDQLALATHNGLLSSLSSKGAAALKAQIEDVKRHMKIIPPPKM